MKTRIIVSAVIEHEGKFLFGRKPKDVGPYPNTWHILGGGVHIEQETLMDAIKREIQEEAGIELSKIEAIGFDEMDGVNKNNEKVHYVFHYYKANYKSGVVKPGDDIAELQWFSKEKLMNLPLPEPSIVLFKKIGLL